MSPLDPCLVDTNILLRISRPGDPHYSVIRDSLVELERLGVDLHFGHQNIAEFWNVSTRPALQNGYGMTLPETNQRIAAIEATMTLLPDSGAVYDRWRRLVRDRNVRGVQVHDARLVALMQVHGVGHILTLKGVHFARYTGITVIDPRQPLLA